MSFEDMSEREILDIATPILWNRPVQLKAKAAISALATTILASSINRTILSRASAVETGHLSYSSVAYLAGLWIGYP